MNKMYKFCSFIFIMIGLIFLVACNNHSSGIDGKLSYEAKRNELEVTAEFTRNEKLENGTAKVAMKLYNADESFKTSKDASVKDGIQATVSFTGLEQNTKYIIKLFVSVSGYEEEIDKIEASTKNEGHSEETAITIQTVDDFMNIKNDTSAYYKLNADLDLKDEGSISLFTSSSKFTGTFDGQGHKISNVKFTSTEYAGLFGYMSEATVKNLNLESFSLDTTTSTKNFGAVAGRADRSTIENVHVNDVKVTTTTYSTSAVLVGGFIGRAEGTKMTDCSVEGVDFALNRVSPSASYLSYIGLFAGHILGNAETTNCHAKGQMTIYGNGSGMLSLGGFAGVNDSAQIIKSCYSEGTIKLTTGTTNGKELTIGGFIGRSITGQCNIEDCVAIVDMVVLSNEKEEEAPERVLADQVYVGGLIGKVEISSLGIKNCYYASLENGIKIICKEATEEQKDNYKASLTIANAAASLANKISDIYAWDSISTVQGMTLDTSNVSKEKITVLSDALQNLLKDRA